MSFNGSGTFQINTAGQPVVTGTVISSTAFNALTADLATGLSTCVTKDGQTNPTANLPMAGYKLTGLGNGSANTDSATLGQVQSNTVSLIGSISGTDTITGSLSPAITAYASGQMFWFVAAADNTGAVTLNVNSLGAKNVTKNGSTALTAGEIKSGQTVAVIYDGTRFQIVNPVVIGLSGITTTTVTALGTNAGDSSTNGGLVAVGYNAGTAVTSGYGNTAVGYNSLKLATNGEYNVAVGIEAGDAISSGSYNTCVGTSAGGNVTSGGANTFIGTSAGNGVSSGSNNTAVGDSAFTSGNYSNSTCLGQGTAVTGSNQVQLGNSSTTTYAYGAVADRASDARDKADIQDTNLGLNFIMALRPRMYRWDYRIDYTPPKPSQDAPESEWDAWREACKLENLVHDGTHKRTRLHQGLIAQEVKQVMDNMGVDFGGYQDFKIKGGEDGLTIAYGELFAPLIKAIQELKADFDAYKASHP
jgi:hypothetical protein